MERKEREHGGGKPPVRQAVAIKYDPRDVSPRVVAKGSGHVHDRIVEKAKENKVAVYSDPELIKELNKIELGEGIPPELYEVVAEVLVFISDLDRLESFKSHAKKP